MMRSDAPSVLSSPQAAAREGATPDLGILLVHGIGDQREGETLLAFGEPIIDYLRRIITRSQRRRLDHVVVSDAMLMPSKRLDARAAYAQLDIRVPPADPAQPPAQQRWLMVEAWWGEQVIAPRPLALIGWLMTRGPWVSLLHIVERSLSYRSLGADHLRAQLGAMLPRPVRRWLDASSGRQTRLGIALATVLVVLGVVLVWIPLSALLQLLLAALALLAVIPLPRVGRAVSALLLRLSGVLGDSYVLIQHEAQRAAIAARLRETLVALRDSYHCKQIAIVAHSQGTAVVYDALRGEATPRPALLVTFGSGLAKLEQLRIAERLTRGSLSAAGWVVPLLAAALLLWLRTPGGSDVAQAGIWGLGLAALFCFIAACVAIGTAGEVLGEQRGEQAAAEGLLADRWVDVCATHDPVPHAPLRLSLARPEIEDHWVMNRASFVSDHTTYFDNRAEFVPIVVHALADAAKLGLSDAEHDELRAAARKHHALSVHLLSWTRLACAGAVVLLGFVYWQRLCDDGARWLTDASSSMPAPIDAVRELLQRGAGWVDAIAGRRIDEAQSIAFVALLLAAFATWLWRHLFAPLWRWWDRVLIDDALADTNTLGRWGREIAAPFLIVLGLLPAVIIALYVNELPVEQSVVAALGWLFAAVFGTMIAIFAVIELVRWLRRWRRGLLRLCARFRLATDPRARWRRFVGVLALALVPLSPLFALVEEQGAPLEAWVPMAAWFSLVALLLLTRLARLMRLRGWRASDVAAALAVLLAGSAMPLLTQQRLRALVSVLVLVGLAAVSYAAMSRRGAR